MPKKYRWRHLSMVIRIVITVNSISPWFCKVTTLFAIPEFHCTPREESEKASTYSCDVIYKRPISIGAIWTKSVPCTMGCRVSPNGLRDCIMQQITCDVVNPKIPVGQKRHLCKTSINLSSPPFFCPIVLKRWQHRDEDVRKGLWLFLGLKVA